MTYRELKDRNRTLSDTLLKWMGCAVAAMAQVAILTDKLKRQTADFQRLLLLFRQRENELRLRGSGNENRLAQFILAEIPGEPSRSEGAVDTAIRLLRKHIVTPAAKAAARANDPQWRPSRVLTAMRQMNELISTLPEKKFLREEPLQLVILRALRRMHSAIELYKAFEDTRLKEKAVSEEVINALVAQNRRLNAAKQDVIETLNDALVGHPEFNDESLTVEARAANCIRRLGAENIKLRNTVSAQRDKLDDHDENLSDYRQSISDLGKDKERLSQSIFELTDKIALLSSKLRYAEERRLAEVQARKDSNDILAGALENGRADKAENPLFYANRAAQTINVIRQDNIELRTENRRLREQAGGRIPVRPGAVRPPLVAVSQDLGTNGGGYKRC